MVKRFLFILSDTGGGHRAPAQAVCDALMRLYGDRVSVQLCDILVELGLWPFRNFPRWYPHLVKLHSLPWGLSYRLSDHEDFMERVSLLTWPYASEALQGLLRRYAPDVIVSFHPIPNYALLEALRRMRLQTPLLVVAVDLVNVHAGWFAPGARTYFVPTWEARQRALRWSVRPERIQVLGGMPIRRAFVEARELSRAAARAQLGLPQDKPLLLMLGGGDGMGPLETLVRAVVLRCPKAHLVAIAGRNRLLYERLRHLDLPVPVQVEGFVRNMEVWMRAADLLLTKAGSSTLAEAFVSGLPVVVYAAIRGQEEGNVAYVTANHLGVWAPGPQRAAQAAIALLADPQRRRSMAERARTIMRPNVAEVLARRLWRVSHAVRPLSSVAAEEGPSAWTVL